MDCIGMFKDLVTDIEINGFYEDYISCKIFLHSLSGDASSWLN